MTDPWACKTMSGCSSLAWQDHCEARMAASTPRCMAEPSECRTASLVDIEGELGLQGT